MSTPRWQVLSPIDSAKLSSNVPAAVEFAVEASAQAKREKALPF